MLDSSAEQSCSLGSAFGTFARLRLKVMLLMLHHPVAHQIRRGRERLRKAARPFICLFSRQAAGAISASPTASAASKNPCAKRRASAMALSSRASQLSPTCVLIRTEKLQDMPRKLEWLHRTVQRAVSESIS
jgi:hypothetical protein